MLGRKLTGGASFVCLRCLLQLAGPPRRLPFPAVGLPSARYPRRYNGTHTALTSTGEPSHKTDGDTNTDPGSERSPEFGPDSRNDRKGVDETLSNVLWPSSAPPPSPLPNRTYKSRGHLLSPEQEGLSVAILGSPGSAIVLREKRALRKRRQHPELEPDATVNAPVDPTSLLPDEGTGASSEDFLLNIHELKPDDTQVLTDKQFKNLRRTLLDGFTNTQLALYIKEYQETRQFQQKGDEEEERDSEETPWVLERQPWVPSVENAAEEAEPLLEGYVTRGMTPKERLVTRLMRECWDVSNQKVLDKDGHLSLRLSDAEFSLLTLGNRRWLEGTPRAILSHVKQVKLIRESRTVYIVAPQHAAESIVDRINRILSYARTSDFAADLISAEPLEPGVLDEVGRMTNTVTRFDSSNKKIVVTWIHMPERNENFENAAETVLRFLRDAYGPKPRVSSAVSVVPSDPARRGRYLPILGSAQKLPWQERFEKWERWTAALPQPSADTGTQHATVPANILPFTNVTDQVIQNPKGSIDAPPDWSSELQTDTAAIFGHVAFARGQPRSPTSTPPSQQAGPLDISLPRTFVPAIPALGSLSLPSNLHEEGLWHSTIVVRFMVSPDISPNLVASAPELELRIEADNKEIKRLVSLRAIAGTFTGDVLFPAAAVDTRLIQQRYFQLPGASIEHYVPPMLTFLSKSDLRPWDGKLSTPPVLLGVRLPRRFTPLNNSHSSNSEIATNTADATTAGDNDGDLVKIDYTLAGIEVQRTVSASYNGLKLRYTSIQGGQRGGERSELALDALRVIQTHEEGGENGAGVASPSSSPFEAEPPYELVDDHEQEELLGKPVIDYHSRNSPEGSTSRRQVVTEPVEAEEFLQAVSSIVNETGGLKWHAKRS